MKIKLDFNSDFEKSNSWLKKVSKNIPNSDMSMIAKQGVESLKKNTPKDTGDTASGWVSSVNVKGNMTEISWKNTAHPEEQVNIAKLIELGHGTGTGGYVQPKPYIKEAMKHVFDTAGDKVMKGMIK